MLKKVVNFVKNNQILAIIIALILFLLPLGLNVSPETDSKAVITGIGIDLKDENIEVSSLLLVPEFSQQGFKENRKVITTSGNTMGEAFEKLSIVLGKRIGLAHCGVVVIGEEFANRNIIPDIDYLFRGKRIGKNSTLIKTKNAKELITASSKISNSFSLSLENIVRYNQVLSNGLISDIQKLYIDYYANNNVTFVPIVDVVEEDVNGLNVSELQSQQSGSGGGDSEQGSSQGGNQSGQSLNNKSVSNAGNCALIKNGMVVDEFTSEQIKKYNWLDENSTLNVETLTNITDEYYDDAEVTILYREKFLDEKYIFKNGRPEVHYDIKFIVGVENVKSQDDNIHFLNRNKNYITEAIKNALSYKVRSEIGEIVNYAKSNNIDLYSWNENFNKYCHNDYKNYLKSLQNSQAFVENVNVFVKVTSYSKA